jgi:2-phospho-L-lactate guanylyltransferase
MEAAGYVCVVPVKPPAVGKSRLVGPSDDARRGLAAAFALDTVTACLETQGVVAVLAVTDDAPFSRRLAAAGCAVIPDGLVGDLNGCLRLAAAEAQRRWPHACPVAVCADLPALRSEDLRTALDSVPDGGSAFVSDASGVGTTMYVAAYDDFDPRFGPGSRAAHLAAGAVEIPGDLTSLRRDVDDADDLRVALELGVGTHTRDLDMR